MAQSQGSLPPKEKGSEKGQKEKNVLGLHGFYEVSGGIYNRKEVIAIFIKYRVCI